MYKKCTNFWRGSSVFPIRFTWYIHYFKTEIWGFTCKWILIPHGLESSSSAALWCHKTAAWCSSVEVGGTPITVHGMDTCLLNEYGLPYVSLGGVTGEFHSFPIYGVVVFSNMVYNGWMVQLRDRVLLSCPFLLHFLQWSHISLVFLFPYSIPPFCLTHVHTRAILTRDLVHHPCILLWGSPVLRVY